MKYGNLLHTIQKFKSTDVCYIIFEDALSHAKNDISTKHNYKSKSNKNVSNKQRTK